MKLPAASGRGASFDTTLLLCYRMIPEFLPNGNLPPGIHDVSWHDFCERFGYTAHRKSLLDGLASALKDLSVAGCKMVYND
jgi:hypothetical protein